MITRKEYLNLITKSMPLTSEEKKQVEEYEAMLSNAYIYQEDISSPEVDAVRNSYEAQMQTIATTQIQNDNMKEALDRQNQMFEGLEKLNMQSLNNEEEMTLTRTLNSSKAGFSNAMIIIFIVLLIGSLIAIGLLILTK